MGALKTPRSADDLHGEPTLEIVDALNALSAMGCGERQGYFFAKPLEAADVAHWAGMYRTDGRGMSVAF